LAQIEMAEAPPQTASWVLYGTSEGHLALDYSPAGAFSPDSSLLAVANGDQVALMDLKNQGAPKVLRPQINGVMNLEIESANFLDPAEIFILCRGEFVRSKKNASRTPELAIRWDVQKDALAGKVDIVNATGNYGAPRWFPNIRYLGMNQASNFQLWDPFTGKGGNVTVPSLTRSVNLFSFSPDGRWLLLAQVESSNQPDPIVVARPGNQFVNALKGHQGAVLSMEFSHDSSKVVTASEDGKVRIYSTAGWNLEHTLSGHQGAVRWADFSPNGLWVVSGGDDKTVRVWSADSGELLQTLRESQEPVLTVAFSPDQHAIAASTAHKVLVWRLSTGISLH
jgi:WD domain, G-beta repeat